MREKTAMKRECDDKQLKKWIRQIADGDTEALVSLYDALFRPLCFLSCPFWEAIPMSRMRRRKPLSASTKMPDSLRKNPPPKPGFSRLPRIFVWIRWKKKAKYQFKRIALVTDVTFLYRSQTRRFAVLRILSSRSWLYMLSAAYLQCWPRANVRSMKLLAQLRFRPPVGSPRRADI